MEIKLTPDLDNGLIELLGRVPGGLNRAISKALRASLKGARGESRRKMSSRYVARSSEAARTLKISVSGTTGQLKSTGARQGLEVFKIKPSRRPKVAPANGIYAQVVKGQGGNINTAFLSGAGRVYERVGRARYPLERITAVSAPQMVGSPPVSSYVAEKIAERWETNLSHEVAAVLGGF